MGWELGVPPGGLRKPPVIIFPKHGHQVGSCGISHPYFAHTTEVAPIREILVALGGPGGALHSCFWRCFCMYTCLLYLSENLSICLSICLLICSFIYFFIYSLDVYTFFSCVSLSLSMLFINHFLFIHTFIPRTTSGHHNTCMTYSNISNRQVGNMMKQ